MLVIKITLDRAGKKPTVQPSRHHFPIALKDADHQYPRHSTLDFQI